MRANTLVRVAAKSVLEGRSSARDVAETIGKPYTTLMRELDPLDRNAKLGVETLLDIVRATGDAAPLQRLARELGYALAPGPGAEQLASPGLGLLARIDQVARQAEERA